VPAHYGIYRNPDHCHPAIRLAAMMQIRTTFVMTHDSIGLGEDGPTHQPVEQLAALRAIPHLAVYRPGDAVETAECWENILDTPRRAALLALSRQPMPLLQRESGTQNKSSRGAYILLEARGRPPPAHLDGDGLRATPRRRGQGGPAEGRHPDDRRVHALPLLFEEQDLAYKRAVMGDPCSRGRGRRRSNSAGSAISASRAASLGCTASASPARSDVYKKFDITTDAVVRWWLTAAAPA